MENNSRKLSSFAPSGSLRQSFPIQPSEHSNVRPAFDSAGNVYGGYDYLQFYRSTSSSAPPTWPVTPPVYGFGDLAPNAAYDVSVATGIPVPSMITSARHSHFGPTLDGFEDPSNNLPSGPQMFFQASIDARDSEGSETCELTSLTKADVKRKRIELLLEQELRNRHPLREDWQKKCTEMASQLEEVLFRNAKTLAEYSDESTVSLRLLEVFMAKRKKELMGKERGGDEICSNILSKAATRWLSGDEILVLLMRSSRKFPGLLTMNNSAFKPPSGALYYFSSPVTVDGYNWLKASMSTDALQEHRFLLTVAGQPRVWVALNVDFHTKMHRRTYWLSDNSASGVLVHYLKEPPAGESEHAPYCFCLGCLLKNDSTDPAEALKARSSAKRVKKS